MKRLKIVFFALVVLSTIAGCGVHPAKKMGNIIERFPIGTSEKDFKSNLDGEQLVYSDKRTTIYKVVVKTYNYIYHTRKDYRFFYFKNGVLSRVDKGERGVDFRIKID